MADYRFNPQTYPELQDIINRASKYFPVTYGTTTYAEISSAITVNQTCICEYNGKVFAYDKSENSTHYFTSVGTDGVITIASVTSGDVWAISTLNMATEDYADSVMYASLMEDTASGSIASFPDGAENVPVKELTAYIEPIQVLHGQASPYPPNGGKNKLKVITNSTPVSDVTFIAQTDSAGNVTGVVANGLASAEARSEQLITLPAGDYILTGCPSGGSGTTYLQQLYINNSFFGNESGAGLTFTLAEETACKVYMRIASGYNASNILFKPMVCLSSATDPTVFAPYSNICPISGYTGAEITRTGKQLFDKSAKSSANGYQNNYYLQPNGTTTYNTGYYISEYIPVAPSTDYTFSGLAGNVAICEYDANKAYITGANTGGTAVKSITTSANTAYIRASIARANEDVIQLEYGSTATAYEAYNGTVYNIDWTDEAGTVYGGHFVVNEDGSVDLTVDHAYMDLTARSWSLTSWNGWRSETVNSMAEGPISDLTSFFCDTYKPSTYGTVNQGVIGVALGSSSNKKAVYIVSGDAVNTPTGHLVYPLATPQTYHLDSIGQITTLLGDNVIWSNTGDISVKYRANTALYIEKKLG